MATAAGLAAALAAGVALILLAGTLTPALASGAGPAAAADPPVLAMSSSVSPNPLVIGGSAVYTVTVQNTGSPATGTVTTTLPFSGGALTFGTLPAGCVISDAANQIVTCTAASIAAGGSVTYQIPVTVAPSLSDGTNIALRGTATSPGVSGASTQLIVQAFTKTDVAITKTGPATVSPGGTITYTITVTNNGPSNAVSVTWHDATNGNLTTITSYPCGNTGLTVSCNVGTLTPGQTHAYTITATVKPSVPPGTVIPDCAVVYTGTSPDTNPDNNQSCINTTVTGAPTPPVSNIELLKTAPATVQQGGAITYHASVTNHGPDPATNVVITDVINVAFISISGLPPECSAQGQTVTCRIPALAVGETKSVTASVILDPAVAPGTNVMNCASVTSQNLTVAALLNSDCVQTEVVAKPSARVEIGKSGPATARPGDTFDYTLTVTNHGPDDAAGVIVTDPVDASQLTVVTVPAGCLVSSGTVTCDVGALPAGATRSFVVTVRVNGDVAPGTVIRNCDSVVSSTANPGIEDTAACVNTFIDPPVPVAEVTVTKSAPAAAHAGDTIAYTLSVTNHGPDDATDLVVKDPLDASLVTAAVLPAECNLSASTVICDAGTLAVGQTKTFTITVTVAGGLAAGTEIDNCGSAASVSTILPPVPQSACTTTVIVPPAAADISMAKTGPATVAPGGTITYTLTATDNGPDGAADVIVTEPVNTALVTVTSLPAGCAESAGTVTCLAGNLAAGESRSFTVTVQVNPGIEGIVIGNCALAYTTTRDPDLGNNESCVNTDVSDGGPAPPLASLEVVKHGPSTANAGGTFSYSIDVTNHGPGDASAVVVTDPVDLALLSVVEVPADCVLTAGTVSCLAGTLAVGQTKTFSFTVRVAAGAPAGAMISNCASAGSVIAAVRELSPAGCTQTLVLPAQQAHLIITKSAPRTVRPGETVTYLVTLTNTGPDAAHDLVVKDPIRDPGLITIVSIPAECTLAGVTATCGLATLAAGQTMHYTAVIRVKDNAPDRTVLDNCIAVYSPTQDTDTDLSDIQSCVNTIVRSPFVPVTG